jgi:hypothetical protein
MAAEGGVDAKLMRSSASTASASERIGIGRSRGISPETCSDRYAGSFSCGLIIASSTRFETIFITGRISGGARFGNMLKMTPNPRHRC